MYSDQPDYLIDNYGEFIWYSVQQWEQIPEGIFFVSDRHRLLAQIELLREYLSTQKKYVCRCPPLAGLWGENECLVYIYQPKGGL